LLKVKDLVHFENFVRILAGRVGQLLNINSISNDIGISSTTLSHWLSVLEASFIVFRLFPYYENFGKRLIKTPKIYFTDVGLVSYLLGIETPKQVLRDPLLGGLFENMIVMEAVKTRLNKGLDPKLYFFRDSNGNEVDLIFNKRSSLTPIEVKAAMTHHPKLTKGISYFQKINKKVKKGYLIYSGDLTFESKTFEVLNFKETYKALL
jgi:predicted AAA+ superfamily ATPase